MCFVSINSVIAVPPSQFLQESLTLWINTELQTNTCGMRIITVYPGSNYYIGHCVVQDPTTGKMV